MCSNCWFYVLTELDLGFEFSTGIGYVSTVLVLCFDFLASVSIFLTKNGYILTLSPKLDWTCFRVKIASRPRIFSPTFPYRTEAVFLDRKSM